MFRFEVFRPPDAMASSNPCHTCGKGRHPVRPCEFRGNRTGGNSAGPEKRVDSMAEAELLSQAGAIAATSGCRLAEMFRRFPAPEGWGGHYLDPDLAVYGVLRKKDCSSFWWEYDGYWRHGEEESMLRDQRKRATLLANAPPGSWVVRLSQTTSFKRMATSCGFLFPNGVRATRILWERCCRGVLHVLLGEFEGRFPTGGWKSAADKGRNGTLSELPAAARKFCDLASALRGASTQEEINNYLSSNGFCTTSIEKLEQKLVAFSCSIWAAPGTFLCRSCVR